MQNFLDSLASSPIKKKACFCRSHIHYQMMGKRVVNQMTTPVSLLLSKGFPEISRGMLTTFFASIFFLSPPSYSYLANVPSQNVIYLESSFICVVSALTCAHEFYLQPQEYTMSNRVCPCGHFMFTHLRQTNFIVCPRKTSLKRQICN